MTTAIQVRPFGHARRRLPLLAALALASAGAFAGTPINERIAADPAGQVEISNISGLVDVTAWARNEVEVTGELGKGAERLEVSRTGNVVRVKVILPSKSSRAESSELFVKLPAGSSLAINTVSADIVPWAVGTLSNTATVAPPGGTTDPTPGNNSATDNDTALSPTSDLRITKSDGSFFARLKSRQVSRNSDREGSSQAPAASPVAGSIHSVSRASISAHTSF